MKTLYIDTHLFDINIILFENNNILKEEHIINQKKNSIYLVPSLKKVCEKETIDEIVVITGPGSFTGTRLGVTIAKTYAYTQNIPIKAINYFDIMNKYVEKKDYILGINDGNGFFIAEYENDKLIKPFYYANNKDINFKDKIITDVTIDYTKLLNYFKEVKPINPHLVNPIYIKLIGVENDNKHQ